MVGTLLMLISIIISTIIIFFALFLIGYLQKYSNKYPYKTMSSFWLNNVLIIILLSQIYATITHFLWTDSSKVFIYLQMFNTLIISNLKLICLFMRTLSIYHGISYNYSHLTQKYLSDTFSLDDDSHFKKTFFLRTFRYMKVFISLIILLVLITFTLFGINPVLQGQCLHYDSFYSLENIDTTNITIGDLYTGVILVNSISYILFALNFFYIIFLFEFNIKDDKFNAKAEVQSSFIISFFFFNFLDIIHFLYKDKLPISFLFLRDSLVNLSLLVLFFILCIVRYNSFIDYSIDYLKDSFDHFMQYHVTFKLFKDYIKLKHNDSYRYLFFWADYFSFKQKIDAHNEKMKVKRLKKDVNIDEPSFMSGDRFIINENEEALKRFAQMIFKDYFMINSVTESISRSNTISIDLPSDIYDKLEEFYHNNFTVENMDMIYYDAYNWIRDKLEKIFEEFKGDRHETEKVERIMFYIECFDVIKDNMNHV